MKISAILALIVGCCVFSFSQNINFTRNFETVKKSLPLSIINAGPGHFYVLRYNKLVHDITIERRASPTGEITGFTPLKLDSVNANWFNYENLDYLFFEQHKKLYFLFEKIVNSKKTLYLKIIDTLVKSSGFIQLATMDNDHTLLHFDFSFSTTVDNNILITAAQTYHNYIKKTVMLFDIEKIKMRWTKKLPLENNATGYSTAFACNKNNDLFYVMVKSRVVGTQRKYAQHAQVQVPVYFYDTLSLVSYQGREAPIIHKKPFLNNLWMINSMCLFPNDSNIVLNAFYSLEEKDSTDKSLFFLNEKLSLNFDSTFYTVTTPLSYSLKKQLSFYDGTDTKMAGDKEYQFSKAISVGTSQIMMAERKDEDYYKELIVWRNDPHTGRVLSQAIIPRKVSVFAGRARFKNIPDVITNVSENQLDIIVLEAPENLSKQHSEFKFNKFKKETKLWRSNIVMYSIKIDGNVSKKLIYHNGGFDLVPLHYNAAVNRPLLFYFNSGRYEKFGFLD